MEELSKINNDYYLDTPPTNDSPIISLLMCYRASRDINTLYNLFDSAIRETENGNLKKIEFLIKFDSDDKRGIKEFLIDDSLIKKHPNLIIRPFIYRRWEGRHSLNLHYMFLFSRRNKSSKFIKFISDDSEFYQDPIPTITPFLNDNYIICSSRPHSIEKLDSITDYRTDNRWISAYLTGPLPLVSSKIIEIIGNTCWGLNTDNWLTLLNLVLYHKYKINIVEAVDFMHLCGRVFESYGDDIFKSSFNIDMLVSVNNLPKNLYYFDLVEQQAKNIYLNMKEDGLIK